MASGKEQLNMVKKTLKSILITLVVLTGISIANVNTVYAETEVIEADGGIVTVEYLEEDITKITVEPTGLINYVDFMPQLYSNTESTDYSECYKKIHESILNFETEIDVSEWNIPIEEEESFFPKFIHLYPDIFYINRYCLYNYNDSIITKIEISFSMDQSEIQTKKKELDEALNNVIASVDTTGLNDLQKALAYHDYLAAHTKYALQNDEYTKPLVNSVYGALVNNNTACEGYSGAYKLIMDRLGIETYMVLSTKANHAWNIIKIDGKWYYVDVTHDDPTWDVLGRVFHTFFALGYNELLAIDSDRDDTIIFSSSTMSKEIAAENRLEDSIESILQSGVIPVNGKLYYIKSTNSNDITICEYDTTAKSETVIKSVTDNRNYSGGFRILALYKGDLVYSDGKCVYAYSLANKTEKTVYTMTASDISSGYRIYGLGEKNNNKLYFTKYTSPNPRSDEIYIDISYSNVTGSIKGDANGDGKITSIDASEILKFLVGAGDIDASCADVNGDGAVTSLDVVMILQYLVGIIKEFK